VKGVSPADEANAAVETLARIGPLLPGPAFQVHDGAMTSEHNQTLLTQLGVVLVNKPRAKKNPKVRGVAVGDRIPDEGLVGLKTIKRADGLVETLDIYQVAGRLGYRELREDGQHHFMPMTVTKLIMNENRQPGSAKHPGSTRYRPYVALKLPPEMAVRLGRREITVALYQTAEDKKRNYLRTARARSDPASVAPRALVITTTASTDSSGETPSR